MNPAATNESPPPPLPVGRAPAAGRLTPWIGPALRQRKVAAAFAVFGAAQIGLAIRRLPGSVCPMLALFGVPCPACGASRACGALARGDWHEAFRMHALAPVFLAAAMLFAAAAVLPVKGRDALADGVGHVERRTGGGWVVVAVLLLYWLARLAYAPHEFIQLMRG